MGIANRIRNALRLPTDAERERNYLDQSTSLIDLESRQREVDRGLFRNRQF